MTMSRAKTSHTRNPMNHNYAEIVDDIYLAYVGTLSATADRDFAHFIAEYTAPRPRAESEEEAVRPLPKKVPTIRV